MRRHPTIGHQILKGVSFLDEARGTWCLPTRSSTQGAGYPNHLKGDQIPIGARVIHDLRPRA